MKKCVNCKKKIREKEHYFEVIERNKSFIVNVTYAHKKCQDEYDKLTLERQISPEMKENLISGLKKANYLLTEMGGQEVINI